MVLYCCVALCCCCEGLDVSEIAFVEAVGGCTRIPWVQRCVSEVFGKEISRTLAGDECVARGCALQVRWIFSLAWCGVHMYTWHA